MFAAYFTGSYFPTGWGGSSQPATPGIISASITGAGSLSAVAHRLVAASLHVGGSGVLSATLEATEGQAGIMAATMGGSGLLNGTVTLSGDNIITFGFGVPILGDEISVWMNDTEYEDWAKPPMVVTVPIPTLKRPRRDLTAWLTANDPKPVAAPLLKAAAPIVVAEDPSIAERAEAERIRLEDEEDTELRLFLLLAS